VEPIAVLFTVPEDTLRLLLPKIRDRVLLPVDVFDRSGATRLTRGTVLTVDNQIDQSTGTVRIKAIFDNKDHLLFPAQFVNVQLDADVRRDQVVVPAVAVQHGPNDTFVYVIQNGKAIIRPVKVGIVEGDRASIDSGLAVGENVVTDSTDRLRDGSQIEIRTPGQTGGAGAAAGTGGAGRQGRGRPTRERPAQ
jgi:membrane fusion protein, multidrug efflux system